jgi:hypothetical protein
LISTALSAATNKDNANNPKIQSRNRQSTITNPAIVNPQSLQSTTSDQHSSIINPQ